MDYVLELIGQQKYTEAIKLLEEQIKTDPSNPGFLSDAGYCYARAGNMQKAADRLNLACRYAPDDAQVWQQYSQILYQLGHITSAINALSKIVKYNPDNAWTYHQLGFLYKNNKDYANSLKHIDKAIEICSDSEHQLQLLSLKAEVLENLDIDRAVETYFSIIENNDEEAAAYDRISGLIMEKFKFSTELSNINRNNPDYNNATGLLRKGELDKAISLYKSAINKDRFCYPAYLGISQALYEKKFGSVQIDKFSPTKEISELFNNYEQLNDFEKNLVNASVSPLQNFVPHLVKRKSHFTLAPVDVKLTDYPVNLHLKNKSYLEDMNYCSLRGIGGKYGYVGIERLRDLIWEIPEGIKFTPACVAHEYGHQVWCLLDEDIMNDANKLYKRAKKDNSFISNYSSRNVQEYFAEYYAYYARLNSINADIPENDNMIDLINTLKDYKPKV